MIEFMASGPDAMAANLSKLAHKHENVTLVGGLRLHCCWLVAPGSHHSVTCLPTLTPAGPPVANPVC